MSSLNFQNREAVPSLTVAYVFAGTATDVLGRAGGRTDAYALMGRGA